MPGEVVQAGIAASTTVYKGTLAGYNSSGYIESKDASGNVFAGVLLEGGVGTTTAGETKALLARKGSFEFEMSGAGLGTVGDELYVVDNQTVAATGTHKVGRASKYENSGKIFIDIGGYC
jgi:hypothetical protein